MRASRGFTLMEIMIALGILGILAGVAVPQYIRTVERGYWRSAQDILRTIYTGEQVYYTVNQKYTATPGTLGEWRSKLYMDNPNTGGTATAVSYTIAAGGAGPGATFTATAKRLGGTTSSGKTITLTQNGEPFGGSWTMP